MEFNTFKSAGAILYNSNGYWLGLERKTGSLKWSDYGGKREGDETAWQTAVRECKEEAGVDISQCILKRAPDFHRDSNSKHVVFWVETNQLPDPGYQNPNFLDHVCHSRWPDNDTHPLHPRLLYDKGSLLKKSRKELGFD